ncbi:MAG: ATP-binding protein [Candidatus Latescibacteria bacterium]|nr:ATP-binding protein [Candidatus Latescibacterota bacterium]
MTSPEPLTVEIRLPSVLGQETIAVAAAAAMAWNLGFSQDRIDDLKTAVSEACLNAIEHGNQLQADVQVQVTLTPKPSGLQVEVADEGPGTPRPGQAPSIEAKLAGQERSRGWGLFLIEQLVDEVTFKPRSQGRSVTCLLIHLDSQEAHS